MSDYKNLRRIYSKQKLLGMGITPEHPDNPVFRHRDTAALLERFAGVRLEGFADAVLEKHLRIRAAHILNYFNRPAETEITIRPNTSPGEMGLPSQTEFNRDGIPPHINVAANEENPFTMMHGFCTAMASFVQTETGQLERTRHGYRWRGEYHSIESLAVRSFDDGYLPWDAAAGIMGFKLENACRKMLGEPPVRDRLTVLIYADPHHPAVRNIDVMQTLPEEARPEFVQLQADMKKMADDMAVAMAAARREVDAATVELRLDDAECTGEKTECGCGREAEALFGYDAAAAQCLLCFNADESWHLRHENLDRECTRCGGPANVKLIMTVADFNRIYPDGQTGEHIYCPACSTEMMQDELGGISVALSPDAERDRLRAFVRRRP